MQKLGDKQAMTDTYDLTYPAWPCPCGLLIALEYVAMRTHMDKVHVEHTHGEIRKLGDCIRCIISEELTCLPVRCPDNHPTGRQNPIYKDGSSTGEFRCEVCHKVYVPLDDSQL